MTEGVNGPSCLTYRDAGERRHCQLPSCQLRANCSRYVRRSGHGAACESGHSILAFCLTEIHPIWPVSDRQKLHETGHHTQDGRLYSEWILNGVRKRASVESRASGHSASRLRRPEYAFSSRARQQSAPGQRGPRCADPAGFVDIAAAAHNRGVPRQPPRRA